MTKTLNLDDLPHTAGLDECYCHPLVSHILFTDGAKYVADQAGAYWLLDEIALAQSDLPAGTMEKFQVWTLRVASRRTATLTCEDGNGRTVFMKSIQYTDFLLPEIVLWVADNVILLPSEY
jgi:hypothetical protein